MKVKKSYDLKKSDFLWVCMLTFCLILGSPLSAKAHDCAPGCDNIWLGDGVCEFTCNVSACNYDNGDCDPTTPGICLLEQVYGKHSEEAELLRHFRDRFLKHTPEGQKIIRLYYEWSPLIVKVLEVDEEFKEDVKKMFDDILGSIRKGME